MKDLVSVIIPAYNHEKYIEFSIKSILNQTYSEIELIICNDGSTDNTYNKILELENKIKNKIKKYKVINQKNLGTSKAIQKMVSIANGEFIFFLASDDFVKKTIIEKLVNQLKKNNKIGMCVVDDLIINEKNERVYWSKERDNIKDIKKATYRTFGEFLQRTSKIDFQSIHFGNFITLYKGNYIPNGYLIRKNILEIPGFFCKAKLLDDLHLMLHVSKYSTISFLNESLYYYRWYNNNSIKNYNRINKLKKKTLAYEDLIVKKNPYLRKKFKYNLRYGFLLKKRNYLFFCIEIYIRQNIKFKVLNFLFFKIPFNIKKIF